MPSVTRRTVTPRSAPPPTARPSSTQTSSVWAPSATRPARPTTSSVGRTSKALFDAEMGLAQCRTADAAKPHAVKVNSATMATLSTVANDLAAQLTSRGRPNEAAQVLREVATLERASRSTSLPETLALTEKAFALMSKLTTRLEATTALPVNNGQQAYNANAQSAAVVSEANLAMVLHDQVQLADRPKWKKTEQFYAGLARRIDAGVDSPGGSLEPMERAGLLKREFDRLAAQYTPRIAP